MMLSIIQISFLISSHFQNIAHLVIKSLRSLEEIGNVAEH